MNVQQSKRLVNEMGLSAQILSRFLKFSGKFDDRGWFEALKGRFIPIFSDDSLGLGFI